ncbi:hypothetical protein I7V27_13640 [Lelliottia amnigena]|uniref:Uncharacterized protein n=1 Tax=Lelliottia amnigena TaxID=61646 RepID=A0AAP2AE48_LELAM|nr:hypothetical protein [Lelliottia amnigena]MBL5899965.1 hypothetical protein [Lelliottia amnigena]MBL5935479.1 hypothetical protein [Lelliottia amnigena]
MNISIQELVAAGHQLSKRLGEPDASVVGQLATQLDVQAALVKEHAIPPMNDDLQAILGRPNFWFAGLAECLRVGGYDIPRKSECEQAVAIHWMLQLYLKHGSNWSNEANNELARIKAAADQQSTKKE